MNKMPELSDEEIFAIWSKLGSQGVYGQEYVALISRAIAEAQRKLLEGWVKLRSEDRLAEILTGCFIAWQRDEENKTFPEYVANRLYKELTEAK